jgi:Uma2 family endonuclease
MTLSISEKVRWVIADLEGFPDANNRYEIIDGDLFVTRAPHLDHQDLIGLVYAALLQWSLSSKLGKPFITPGIIFSESNAVIPDLIWISYERRSQIIDSSGHLTGAPELIVEVLSETEQDKKRDRETKLKLYSVQGVLEYWIVDRQQNSIEVFRQDQGLLTKSLIWFQTDQISSPLLPGFSYPVASLFADAETPS